VHLTLSAIGYGGRRNVDPADRTDFAFHRVLHAASMNPVSADAPAAWVVGNESPTALTAATQGLRPKHIAQEASNGVPYDRAYDTQRAHP
jgi:hypothetical protein